ncbi:MAG: 6-bladed beta-propeller [Rikenellaceae bacterium]|jgi:hypothetical protein|nr:6-bladed beta-propeller [Rikenellaceae bacterium]
MKKSLIGLLCGLFCLVSCHRTETGDLITLRPDPASGKDYRLEELADSVEVILLDGDVLIGEIDVIKSYPNLLVFLEGQSGRLHLFDPQGHHINTLDRLGRGPQEYIDIATFACHPSGEYLVIYSRGTQAFMQYSIPDLRYEKSWPAERYYNAIEFVDSDHLFRTREYDYDKEGGLELYNLKDQSVRELAIKTNYLPLELGVDQMLSNIGKTPLWFTCPGYVNTVYSLTLDAFDPIYRIDFGSLSLPKRLWNIGIDSDSDAAGTQMEEARHAVMPQYFTAADSVYSFWYIVSQSGPPLQLYLFDRESGNDRNVRQIKIEGYDSRIIPVGTRDGYYLSLLYQSLLSNPTLSPVGNRVNQAFSADSLPDKTALLMFRPNNIP